MGKRRKEEWEGFDHSDRFKKYQHCIVLARLRDKSVGIGEWDVGMKIQNTLRMPARWYGQNHTDPKVPCHSGHQSCDKQTPHLRALWS
ncbi:hypothetical protein D623_10007122 [Myotis brandtii]|uniref:Uncharacterized protein n=1 Tax=Myotis brandtii TaxID=109478 RepID=S7Q5N9_MYOBR|nr:hypothetical protein D623_10007122 [Myotis brandtii]